MWLTPLYSLGLPFAAPALVAPTAHLLELPRKIRLTRDEYLLVQRLYRGWAVIGVALLALLALLAGVIVSALVRAR